MKGHLSKTAGKEFSYPVEAPETLNVAETAEALGSHYDLSAKDFADVLEVTPKTLTRWRQKGEVLSPQQCDRVHVLESLLALGEKVLGSSENVKRWIHAPVLYLQGACPLDLLKTETGRRRVEEALRQIEYGMY